MTQASNLAIGGSNFNATGKLSLTTGVTGTLPAANGGTGVTTSTGSGNVVLSTSPTLVTPALGTPSAIVLTNATGLGYGAMPAGSLLQLVSTSTQSVFSTTNTSYTDAGFSLAITPKFSTSKVFMFVTLNGAYHGTTLNEAPSFQMVRGASTVIPFHTNFLYSTNGTISLGASLSLQYLDSPATTSSTTYKLQWYSRLGNVVKFNEDGGGGDTSTITLMEIAA